MIPAALRPAALEEQPEATGTHSKVGRMDLARPTTQLLNGAEAMGIGYWLAGARLAYSFPITPQSEAIEYFAAHPDIQCIQADSEYNVLAGAEGVLWGGERCALATSSQGLILMSEVMWEVAGNRLPMVMGVFSRGLKGPGWSLGTQQNDALFMRDTGWMQFYCETAQEALDFILLAHRLAETVSLPALVVGDGFYLSHQREAVTPPSAEEAQAFVGDPGQAPLPLSSPPASYGALVPPARYSGFYRTLERDMAGAADVFVSLNDEFDRRFGRRYGMTAKHCLEDAEIAVVSAGTVCGAVRQVVNELRAEGASIGLLKIHGFRPFPSEEVADRLGHARCVIVLDRNLSPGWGGIFAGHVRAALQERGITAPVFGMIAGLGGLDVTPHMVRAAVTYAQEAEAPPLRPLFLDETGIS